MDRPLHEAHAMTHHALSSPMSCVDCRTAIYSHQILADSLGIGRFPVGLVLGKWGGWVWIAE